MKLRRSLELLLAEKIFRTGEISHFNDAISHIDSGKYCCSHYLKGGAVNKYIVLVYYSDKVMSIYTIDGVDETVECVKKIGFIS